MLWVYEGRLGNGALKFISTLARALGKAPSHFLIIECNEVGAYFLQRFGITFCPFAIDIAAHMAPDVHPIQTALFSCKAQGLLHAVSIQRMHDRAGLNDPFSIAPNCGRRITMEDTMFKISKSDLKTKSKIQLHAIFNQISSRVPALQNPDLELAQSALAMIDQELARRGPAP
jgi:hypothetical protein